MFHVEHTPFVDILLDGATTFGIKLAQNQVSSLATYYRELERWNQKINLTATSDPREVAIKHFLDSLLFGQALEERAGVSLLDVGSGAGFPGLPLKILAPELHVTLLEPNEKKTSFLRHVVGTLDLRDVSVVSRNLRDYCRETEHHGLFSYVTTRAVAAEQVLPLSRTLLKKRGRVILCLARSLEGSQWQHGLKVSREFRYELPHGYGHRVLTVLEQQASA